MAACCEASSPVWYSGSWLPIIVLDQSNIRWRSSWGTPRRSAMTTSGSSAAMSVTKSAVPVSMTESMMSSVAALIRSWSWLTIRGVNPLLTNRR